MKVGEEKSRLLGFYLNDFLANADASRSLKVDKKDRIFWQSDEDRDFSVVQASLVTLIIYVILRD